MLISPLATSVDVERSFSRSRLLLSYERNRLASESIRGIVCVGLWSQQGLVLDADIKAVTAEKVRAEEVDERDDWDEEEWLSHREMYL
jgi:hypothetical protein